MQEERKLEPYEHQFLKLFAEGLKIAYNKRIAQQKLENKNCEYKSNQRCLYE